MPFLVFAWWAVPVLAVARRIRFWYRVGQHHYAKRLQRSASIIVSAVIALCMSTQIYLVWKMGLAGPGTVLPLHLCSFVGVLTPFMLLTGSKGLFEFCLFLGVPGAVMALPFPAVLPSPWPLFMEGAFFSLHSLLVLAPFLRMADGTKPGPRALGRVFLWANLFMLLVSAVNSAWGTNYLFLRTAPAGTPLVFLQGLGQAAYVAALEAMALLFLKLESILVRRLVPKG